MERSLRNSTGWGIALILFCSVLVGPLKIASALAADPTGPAFGVQFHATWSDYTDAQRTEVLDKMAAAGIKWVRIDIGWASLQEQGRLQWSQWYIDRLESVVDQAQARGIKVLGTLWLTPSWANGGAGTRKPPTNPADYAAAAKFLSGYFKGRIAAWEVWNEPNLEDFYQGTMNEYVGLLKTAYPAFKLGNPSAEVLIGGPAYNDTAWLRKAYEAGAQGFFDIMATHPYQGVADAPPETPDDGSRGTMAHVAQVHGLMTEWGDGSKKIWLTEFGWSSHDNSPGVSNWERGVTLKQQADFAVRSLEYLEAKHPYVTNVFWYNERNNDSGDTQFDNYGLLYRDLTPKPVYNALKAYLTADPLPSVVPTPDPTPPPTDEAHTLLVDGTFESHANAWVARRAVLKRVSAAHSGRHAAKVSGRRANKSLISRLGADPLAQRFSLTGFLRGARPGQRLKVFVQEIRNGSVVGSTSRIVTVHRGWKQFPALSYQAGYDGTRIRVRISALSKARYFLADDLRLRSAP